VKVALIGARGHAGSRNPAELASRGHKIKGSIMACEWGDKGNAQNHVQDFFRLSKRFEAFRFPPI
jgi:putative NADH-flavin reductase